MTGKLLLWSFASFFPLPLVLALNLQLNDVSSMRLYITFGLVAYSWWLMAILLSVRPSWLGRGVGLPSVYAMHGLLGVVALIPAYLHKENTFAPDDLSRLLGEWGFYVALAVLCYSVIFMSGWMSDRSRLVLKVKSRLETIFRRQFSVWIHRLNLVVVILVWLHVHLIGRVNQHLMFMALFDLYTVVVLGIYVWKKWVAPDSFLVGTVRENVALNGSTRSISVELDRTASKSRPGDFYFLSFHDTKVGREWHPFSVTDEHSDVLTFTIRQTGDFTRKVGVVNAGTRVRLEGPFGRFDSLVKDRNNDAPLVLVGMGAGIAPLLSLTAQYAKQRRVHLLWAVRSAEDAYYSTLLEEYQHRSEGRLRVTTQVGRFHRDQVSALLSEDDFRRGEFFVVGPNPAVLAIQRILRRFGVPSRRIHHERLTM